MNCLHINIEGDNSCTVFGCRIYFITLYFMVFITYNSNYSCVFKQICFDVK